MTKIFFVGWVVAAIFWTCSISWIFDAINYYGAGMFLSFIISFLLIGYVSTYFGVFLIALKFFRTSNYRPLIFASIFFRPLAWAMSIGVLGATLTALLYIPAMYIWMKKVKN